MLALGLAVLMGGVGADAASPSPREVRQGIERSLAFLKEEGVAWHEEYRCTSCHALPMAVWSLNEAQKNGFAVDMEALAGLRRPALASYVEHPQLKPVPRMDGEDGLSLATVYLLLGAGAAAEKDAWTAAALDKLAAHIIKTQQANGSWPGGDGRSPVTDTEDVVTCQALLALAVWKPDSEAWAPTRDRALAWLRQAKVSPGNQPLVMRLLVWQRFGQEADWKPLAEQLLKSQNADGGWSQVVDRPSDALATGQALYALAAVGRRGEDAAVRRAWAFLLKSQRADGSWLVRTRLPDKKNVILSYYGSGWATLGLLRTLPVEGRQ
jgi:hypothetical protein